MKKILSILICLIMIAAVAVSTVSADGRILFEDRFDSSDNDDWIWDPDVTHFEVKNGVLVGDPSAVVHIRRSTILMLPLFVHGISSAARSMYGSPIMRIQHPWDPDFGSETMILLISRRQTANPMRERFGTTIMIV